MIDLKKYNSLLKDNKRLNNELARRTEFFNQRVRDLYIEAMDRDAEINKLKGVIMECTNHMDLYDMSLSDNPECVKFLKKVKEWKSKGAEAILVDDDE